MNQLAIIRKHLKGIDVALGAVKVPETRNRAYDMLMEAEGRWWGDRPRVVGVPAETVVIAIPEAVAGVNQGGEALPAALRDEAVLGGFVAPWAVLTPPLETYKGNPVLEPITDHTWEVGEPGPGVMPEVVTTETPAEIPPVNLIGGWPERAEIVISGLAPNRRHLRGTLPDNRVVTVERTMAKEWKAGQKTTCRLIRAGAACLYRVA